jgi:hypothetical protein
LERGSWREWSLAVKYDRFPAAVMGEIWETAAALDQTFDLHTSYLLREKGFSGIYT